MRTARARIRSRWERFTLAMCAPRPDPRFESRWTMVAGLRLHDRATIDGRPGAVPVVLVHGLAVSHRYLMPLAAELAPRVPVRVVDLPGFGLSEEPGRVLGLTELADRLAGWLTATGFAPAALIGNSFGCQVAVELAVRHPALVRCLVLVGPTIDPHARSAPRQVLRWLRDLRHEDLLQAPIILRDLCDAGLQRAARTFWIALGDAIEDKLPAVQVPALVTRGAVEPVVSRRWAEQAADLLPRGEFAEVPGAPHDANYTSAEPLAALVIPFLERVCAQALTGEAS